MSRFGNTVIFSNECFHIVNRMLVIETFKNSRLKGISEIEMEINTATDEVKLFYEPW